MDYIVGVDIGGTKTAIGIVNNNGEVNYKKVVPTDQSISPFKMIEKVIHEINVLLDENNVPKYNLRGIGIGAPGPVDVKEGMIACPPNLKEWVNIPIVKLFKERFSLPIYFENDASAAALGEKWVGAAKGAENFLYMTISTGIGSGIVVNGKIYTGTRGNAGDIGHMVIDPSYGTCTCGQQGCFEWIASGTAIARMGSEILGEQLSTKQVFDLYESGHPEITGMINTVFTRLGMGCVSLINTFEPEMIVIGGGVSNVGDPLFNALREYVSQFALSPGGKKTGIFPTELKGDTGIIGAAALVKYA